MSLDQDLRDTLADGRRALPSWPDAVERVQAGIKLRKRRRRAVVASVVSVLAIAFAAPVAVSSWSSDAQPVGAPDGDVVPWLDSPVAAPDYLARRESRPNQQPCAAKDLGRSAWVEDAGEIGGHRVHTILVSNASDTRCTLSGSASLSAVDGSGARVEVPTQSLLPSSGPSRQYPATVDPGEPARIDIGQAAGCGAGTPAGQSPTYSDLALGVDSNSYKLEAVKVDPHCPVVIGQWYVQPPLLNAHGTAKIDAPPTVRRGATLLYRVSLSSTALPVHAGQCPIYRQSAGGPGSYFRLNCSSGGIEPNEPVTFEMRLAIPADAEPGKTTLEWMVIMADGKVVIADLATGGVPIEILT